VSSPLSSGRSRGRRAGRRQTGSGRAARAPGRRRGPGRRPYTRRSDRTSRHRRLTRRWRRGRAESARAKRPPGLGGGVGGTPLDHTADPSTARFARPAVSVVTPAERRTGANGHLVRPSRCGAPVRPTIAAAISGRVGHSQFSLPGAVLALRRNATFGNYLGRRSRIAKRPSVHLMTVRAPRIPVAITSRVTTDHSASRPDPRYGRANRSTSSRAPSVASRVSGGRSPRLGLGCSGRPAGRSGGAAPTNVRDGRGGHVVPSGDVSGVQVLLDDSRRRDELWIAGDGPGEPVDVRRLESGDLAKRVAVKLAEAQFHRQGVRQRRRRRPAKIADACALERAGGIARPRRLAVMGVEADGRLAWRVDGSPVACPEWLIARPDRPRQVESPGDGPCWLGPRGTASTRRRCVIVEARAVTRRSRGLCTAPGRASRQRRVGLIDLGHLAGCDPRCLRIIAGQVGMVLSGQAPPGSLDLGRCRARFDAEDDEGFAFGHVESVAPARSAPAREACR
jgi:hypothetical protein